MTGELDGVVKFSTRQISHPYTLNTDFMIPPEEVFLFWIDHDSNGRT